MKKLLLVMLVPVLVLGVMGCGKVQDGDPTPIVLQGAWNNDNGTGTVGTTIDLVIAGNQATMFKANGSNIAYRTSYSGDKEVDGNKGIVPHGADNVKITFYWFEEKYDEIGSITCTFLWGGTPAGSTPITLPGLSGDQLFVTKTEYATHVQNVMLPIIGDTLERL